MEKSLILLSAIITVCSAQFAISNSPCPTNIQGKANFNSAQMFGGTWFEYRGLPFTFPGGLDCLHTVFTSQNNLFIEGRAWYQLGKWKIYFPVNQEAEISCNGAECDMSVNIPNIDLEDERFTVIDTDYTSYAALFGCKNTPDGKSMHIAHLMVRDLNTDMQSKINKFLPYTDLKLKDNTKGCRRYYP